MYKDSEKMTKGENFDIGGEKLRNWTQGERNDKGRGSIKNLSTQVGGASS